MSIKAKVKIWTPEHKAKRLVWLNRLNSNPEQKAKNLESLKVLHANPEFQAKRLEGLNRLNSTPEQKERLKRLHSVQSHQVSVLDTLTNETTVYTSIAEAARTIKVSQGTICATFKRKGVSTIWMQKKRYRITKLSSI
jgi:hypothetical protein